MASGAVWLASETCLDIASNVDREEASVFARQRAHATLDGMSPSHRKSWVGKALAVVDAAPSATTLFQPTRRAFLPLSHHGSLTRTLTHLKLQLTFSTFNHFSLPRPTLSSFISSPSDIDLAGITFMRASETGEARKCVSRDVPKTSRVSSDDLPPVASPVTSHYRRKKAKKILDMI